MINRFWGSRVRAGSTLICLFRIRKLLKSRTKWKRQVIVCQWVDLLSFLILFCGLSTLFPFYCMFWWFNSNVLSVYNCFSYEYYGKFVLIAIVIISTWLHWFEMAIGFFLLFFFVGFVWLNWFLLIQSIDITDVTSHHYDYMQSLYWSALSSFCVKNISYLHNFGLNHIELFGAQIDWSLWLVMELK